MDKVLPNHIVHRKGEYDSYGELGPSRWVCGCGSWMTLESLDEGGYQYIWRTKAEMEAWLAKHASCEALCFSCRKVKVERVEYWCDTCSE